MRIYFYPECNFNINKAKTYDVTSLAEWFDSQHKNPDDYEIVGRDGEYHDSDYEGEVCAVYPRIMGGKKKGKNILTAVIGLGLLLATGGTTAALFAHYGGINMAHALGAGLLLSGGGALLMGKMKMPSMDLSSDSATKENYQWSVGSLSTSRGVKGVTYGSNVIPEGELLAYRTYGTSTLEKLTRSETYYVNETYNTGRTVWNTRTRKYEPIYATRKVKKTKTVADSYMVDDESSYLEMLIGAGEGELDSITDIRVNDIPLADLGLVENTDYAIRLGSNTQTALKQTNLDSQAGYQSIGQTVPVKLNGSVTPLLITTPSACDSCCIAFQTPNWYLYDTSSGAKNKAYIKLKIGYRTSGSSGSFTYLTKTGVNEIDSGLPIKAESAFYFQIVLKFPSNGTYQICIENDSAELNNTKGLLSNAEYQRSSLPDRAALNLSVDNIACYNNKEQTYPNTALIWLRLPASQTLNGSMPKVTWKQTRASIYAYNGSSYVTKPADNLAWAIYDIIAQVRKDGNTYHNEGEDVSNIDFDKFVAFASFCDSIGAKGNWFLNKLDTSWSNAMSVATSCRAFIGLRSGKVCPYWDAPTEMTQIFTVGNYEDMSGVITAKKDRAKAIEATFNNEEEKYASRTVRVEIDNDHSAEAVFMTFVGLSNPVNVSKQAHYILRRNKYLVQSIKFTADIDSIVCELNDVIGIQCDLTEYGVGGRIFKVENGTISLDAPVTLVSGNTYALLVRHTDGTLERNTPVETNGTYTQLTFNSAWSKPVLKGDVYSFGIANSEVRKYRVTGITRTNDLKAQIEAIEYNENVYDELAVAPYTYTNPNAGINNVTTTYTPEAVELAWDANNNTSYVNVYVDGVFYGRYQNGAQIPNINSEQLVEMFPVNEYGEEDTPVVRTISNNLPTPSTPPVPIVQSTTTGCVAEFDGIPKDENIVWLIIKEGDNELGRANILGEYMSVSIQLRSGTHTLSAYFVNQFSKSSQARTFTATPLGDIQANDISATALKLPTGSILRLSAKNCTTASIAEANGVKDVSGNGRHGQASGGISVLDGGEGFALDDTTTARVEIQNFSSAIVGATGMTISMRIKVDASSSASSVGGLCQNNYVAGFFYALSSRFTFLDRLSSTSETVKRLLIPDNTVDFTQEHTITVTVDYTDGICLIYVDAVEMARDENWFAGTKGIGNKFKLGSESSNVGTDTAFHGTIKDVRMYARTLTPSEVKTVHMFPDDVTFGQMTADLIGANVIKAQNLIMTENVISNAAQINNAVFQSLIVTNGSTVANQVDVGGRNLLRNTSSSEVSFTSSIKDYAFSAYGISNIGETDDLTLSFEAKASASRWIDFYFMDANDAYYNNSTGGRLYPAFQLTTSYAKYTAKGKRGALSAALKNIRIRQSSSSHGAAAKGVTIYIKNLKIEFGNKATDWTPAPEDVDADSTAKANAVKNGLGTNGYTSIHGGNIMTDTITANAIAANAITAEKITVGSISKPVGALVSINAKGIKTSSTTALANGTYIGDSSGNGNAFKTTGSIYSYNNSNYGNYFVTNSTASIDSVDEISIFDDVTYRINLSISDFAPGETTANAQWIRHLSSSNTTGIIIGIRANGAALAIDHYLNGSRTWQYNISYAFALNTFYDIVVTSNSSRTTLYINGVRVATSTSNKNTTSGSGVIRLAYGTSRGNIRLFDYYQRSLSENEIIALYKMGADPEGGQITADRIAAGCVETRHLTADAIVGKTFQTASNTGTSNAAGVRFNSSGIQGFNGSAKKFDLSTNGKLTCSDVDLTGKITASSGKIGDFSLNQDVSVAVTASETKTYTCGFSGTVKKSSSDTKDKAGIFLKVDSTSSYNACGILIDNQGQYANSGISVKTHGSQEESYGISTLKYGSGTSNALLVQNQGSSTSNYAAGAFFNASSNNVYSIYVSSGKAASAGGWSTTCDESVKKDIKDVSTLDKLKSIRVKKFKYSKKAIQEKEWCKKQEENLKKGIKTEEEKMPEFKDDENAPDYIMAMAGEFNKAFGVDNGNEEEINYTNAIGVCMRAIQELAAEVDELKAKLKIQQNEKSEIIEHFNDLVKEPTGEDELVEPSFDELLKNGENQQKEQKK